VSATIKEERENKFKDDERVAVVAQKIIWATHKRKNTKFEARDNIYFMN
jgi:hypothetical protein